MEIDWTEKQLYSIIGMLMGGLDHYSDAPEAEDSQKFIMLLKECVNAGTTLTINLPHVPEVG